MEVAISGYPCFLHASPGCPYLAFARINGCPGSSRFFFDFPKRSVGVHESGWRTFAVGLSFSQQRNLEFFAQYARHGWAIFSTISAKLKP
jgi:hypothetical protein